MVVMDKEGGRVTMDEEWGKGLRWSLVVDEEGVGKVTACAGRWVSLSEVLSIRSRVWCLDLQGLQCDFLEGEDWVLRPKTETSPRSVESDT